jgi:hypothetical protein
MAVLRHGCLQLSSCIDLGPINGIFLMWNKTLYCIVCHAIPPHLSSKGKTGIYTAVNVTVHFLRFVPEKLEKTRQCYCQTARWSSELGDYINTIVACRYSVKDCGCWQSKSLGNSSQSPQSWWRCVGGRSYLPRTISCNKLPNLFQLSLVLGCRLPDQTIINP